MNQIQKLETWKKDLALAETFEEIKLHDSASAAAAEFARRNNLALEKQNEIGKFRVDVETKKGKWLDENFNRGGDRGNQYIGKVEQVDLGKMPVSKDESSRARKIKNTEEEKLEQIMQEIQERGEVITPNNVHKEIKKEEKKEELQEKKKEYEKRIESNNNNEFKIDIFNTNETFRVIYADPAWSYNDKQDTTQLGGASKHYDTMSIAELSKLPVNKISEKNSILFLWVTSPLLEDAFKVVSSWGFKYKTSFIWDKVKHNMGHYNSVRHEILLVCTKGSCTPDNKVLYNSVQRIERNNNHSEKPIEFLNIIDDLYNYGNKLEMFCRTIKKEKWYGWGNEL